MFLNMSKFSKLIKQAYKTYLIIGNISNGLLISSGSWLVWIENGHISNKIKSIVVEHLGKMPERRECFSVCKDDPTLQDYIGVKFCNMIEDHEDADNKLIVTPLLMNDSARLLQTLKGKIHAVNQEYIDIIDPYEVDYDYESMPTGPCFNETVSSGIYWHNDYGVVMITPLKLDKKDVYAALETVKFDEAVVISDREKDSEE